MQSFIEKIRNFMYGRNGIDKFTFFLLLLYLLVNGIGSFIRYPAVHYSLVGVSVLIVFYALFRVFSKNLYKRHYEEEKFESILVRTNFSDKIYAIKKKFKRFSLRIKQIKTHRFRTCPQCGENLRLSKKRGKRSITCPKCGKEFTVHIFF